MSSSSRVANLYLLHLAKVASFAKEGCIIAAGEWGGDRCLLKNRDRNYKPEIRIYHEIQDGVEVLYARDELTDWTEGLNEHSIGAVNAALMVGRDEAEKEIVKGVGKKSKDGARVRELLKKKTLDDAIETACKFKGGIKGHTFVSDAKKTVSIEQTSEHDCVVKTVAGSRIHVRTNHGFSHEDAGYTEGEDYVSSVSRRDQAKKVLKDVKSPEGIAPAVYGERQEDLEDPNNMVRDTDNMRTTSQLVLNLTKNQMLFYVIPGQVKYLGYKKDLPKGHEPKLTLKVFEYTDIDGDGDFDVALKKKAGRRVDIETERLEITVEDLGGRVQIMAYHKDSLRHWLDQSSDPENKKPVAEATYDYNTEAGTVYLNRTDANRKGQGFAPEMLQAALEYFRGRGLSDAEGYVERDNFASQSMMQKLKFEERRQTEHGSYWGRRLASEASGTPPRFLYHSSPASIREDIAKNGIDWRRSPSARRPQGKSLAPVANFFYTDKRDSLDMMSEGMDESFDLYEIDTSGFKAMFTPDPYQPESAVYTRTPIPPARIKLVQPARQGMASRVAAKYKSKKKIKTKDGEERTIYEYTERQTALRDKKKAERVEALRKKLPELRSKVKKDLKSKDPHERLTALAVALIDETYERIGNNESAKNGHFGVTGWTKKHLTFSAKKAILKYVGKSGVDHVKEITNAGVVSALRDAVKGKKPGDVILCEGDDCVINASKVNAYLKEFDITAKDMRGLHANEEVRARLTEVRKKGPKLPTDKKEREEILKKEFKEAIAAAAEAVGHEASTLRSQYLVPGLEDAFMNDGSVLKRLDKKAMVENILREFTATKTKSEKEDEQAERLVRRAPTKKPPRRDLERGHVVDGDDDPDKKQDKKDRSRNNKDSMLRRVVAQFLLMGKVTRTDSGKFRAERDDEERPRYFDTKEQADAWVSEEEGEEKEDKDSLPGAPEDYSELEDPKKMQKFRDGVVQKYTALGVPEKQIDKLLKDLKGRADKESVAIVKNLLDESADKAQEDAYQKKQKSEERKKKRKEELDRDPTHDASNPIPDEGEVLSPEDQKEALGKAADRAKKAIDRYTKMDSRERQEHLGKLDEEIDKLADGDSRKIQLSGVRRGLVMASVLKDHEEATGIGSTMARLVRAAAKTGKMDSLLSVGTMGGTEFAASDDQALIRSTYEGLDDDEWAGILPDDHPASGLAKLLADPEKSRHMSDADRKRVKLHLIDLMVAETSFLDPMTTKEVGKGATVAAHKDAAKKARASTLPERRLPSASDLNGLKSWFAEAVQHLVQKATGKGDQKSPKKDSPTEPEQKPEEKSEPKPPDKPKDEKEHQPGDVWEAKGEFWGKDPSGNVSGFKTKENAESFASGASGEGLRRAAIRDLMSRQFVTRRH